MRILLTAEDYGKAEQYRLCLSITTTICCPLRGYGKISQASAGRYKKGSSYWLKKGVGFSCFSRSKGQENGAQRQLLLPSRVSRVRAPSPAPEWARSSVAERPAHNRLVAGSNPAEPIA
jgi:hypothetical protein